MSDVLREVTQALHKSQIRRLFDFQNSPFMKASLEKMRAEWLAKPWYERILIRTKYKVKELRIRLGEIIAGQSFEDYY